MLIEKIKEIYNALIENRPLELNIKDKKFIIKSSLYFSTKNKNNKIEILLPRKEEKFVYHLAILSFRLEGLYTPEAECISKFLSKVTTFKKPIFSFFKNNKECVSEQVIKNTFMALTLYNCEDLEEIVENYKKKCQIYYLDLPEAYKKFKELLINYLEESY